MPADSSETVPAVAYHDVARRLTALYDAALEARSYVQATAYTQLQPRRMQLRDRAPDVLDRLDGALADAMEVME